MCGIAGYHGHFNPLLLDKFNLLQAHRGPDGQGVYSDPVHGIGLAHTRLSIQDLSENGRQPMASADGKV